MTKARFDAPQPGVQVKTFGDKSYIYISLHETEGTERTERGEYRYYEYDYHEFCEKTANLDINNIHTHPEKYLNYRPKKRADRSRANKILGGAKSDAHRLCTRNVDVAISVERREENDGYVMGTADYAGKKNFCRCTKVAQGAGKKHPD